MKVTNKIMLHFHKKGIWDEKWYQGNEILVDENFNSYYANILKFFNTAVDTTDNTRQSFDRIINGYLKEKQTEETLIQLLKEAGQIILYTNIFKREKALEEVRLQKYNHLPSRKHSIWVTDEKSKNFWKDALFDKTENNPHQLALFKVSLTGELFKSSDYFLPDNELTYEEILKQAEKYWNPDYSAVKGDASEYLFQGKLKILKKLT